MIESLSNLPKITELVRSRARIQSQGSEPNSHTLSFAAFEEDDDISILGVK